MPDIATATVSGNPTREVELRPLSLGTEVARMRVAAKAGRRSGDELAERTNYSTIEVCGRRQACAQSLGKGSGVVVDGELDWHAWTDEGQNRREAVGLRARQILFERTGSTAPAEARSATAPPRWMTSPVPLPGRLRAGTSDDVPF